MGRPFAPSPRRIVAEALSIYCGAKSGADRAGGSPATSKRIENRIFVRFHRQRVFALRYPDLAFCSKGAPFMTARLAAAGFQQVLLVLGSLVLVIACLSLAQTILVPLVLAILLAFILAPVVVVLQQCGVGRVVAVLVVVSAALIVLATIAAIVTAEMHALLTELPQHQATITEKVNSLRGDGDGVIGRLLRMVDEITAQVRGSDKAAATDSANEPPAPVVAQSDHPAILPIMRAIATPLFEGLANGLAVVVMVTFMLIVREDLRNRLIRLIGHGRVTVTTKALDDAARRISRFLLAQSVINTAFGFALGLGLFVIGVPYALLWGFLAACLRFVPYVGTWIAVLMPLGYSVTVSAGWIQPVAILVLCAVLELIVVYAVEPILLGRSTGIAPFALFVSAAFWAWLRGPVGLILSTPLTSCLVVLGKHVPSLQFLDVVLSAEPVLDTGVRFYQRLLANDQDEAAELVEDYLQTHRLECVCDDVLLPALATAKIDVERGALGEHESSNVVRMVNELLDDLPSLSPTAAETSDASLALAQERSTIKLFACPARDEADKTALKMLRVLLEPSGCRVTVLSAKALPAEVISEIEKESPDLVCIGALPPGGLTQTRYLCKRLRAQLPQIKIIIGRWGERDNLEPSRRRLLDAGADHVAESLAESRHHILAILPVLVAQQSAPTPSAATDRENRCEGAADSPKSKTEKRNRSAAKRHSADMGRSLPSRR
jgi:predicted PurR-regulated permease PerM